jgi:hypothetical protein
VLNGESGKILRFLDQALNNKLLKHFMKTLRDAEVSYVATHYDVQLYLRVRVLAMFTVQLYFFYLKTRFVPDKLIP